MLSLFSALLAIALILAAKASAASSFGGMSSYFLHAFPQSVHSGGTGIYKVADRYRNDRLDVLDAMQAAGSKTLRIFISYTPANQKGTGSVEMPDIEPQTVGVWDDTQLEAIDQLMMETKARGIKLIIAMHDRYQLGCWGNDSYVEKYLLPAIDCGYFSVDLNNVTSWYQNPEAISDFENRIEHILMHTNKFLNREWRHLASHIFSFNIENEGEGHLNNGIAPVPNWWCDRSKFMSGILGSKNTILISTGGGNDWSNSDIPENWACPTVQLVGLHSYDGPASFSANGPGALARAIASNTLVMVEEFGATGATKAEVVQEHIDIFNQQLHMPWSIWEISKPGAGAADFEFYIGEPTYDVVSNGSHVSLETEAAQDFSKYFYDVGGY